MKPAASRAATARVLAEIDAAVRPVERARTAAAVDRVLASAAPSIFSDASAPGVIVAEILCREEGIERAPWDHPDSCPCDDDQTPRDDATGGALSVMARPTPWCRALYAPWNVSPHLFPTDPS